MVVLLLVLNVLVTLAMICCILLQRNEGGALGIGGGGMMASRASADPLTRATAILATIFIVLSILQTIAVRQRAEPASLIDFLEAPASSSSSEELLTPAVPLDLVPDTLIPRPEAPPANAPESTQ